MQGGAGVAVEAGVTKLSPLNFSSLVARANLPTEEELPKTKRGGVRRITMYECPVCEELHEREVWAEDCCDLDEPTPKIPSTSDCPVCGEHWEEHQDAADCCLWKDLDAPTRWRMAESVRNGSTWLDELGIKP